MLTNKTIKILSLAAATVYAACVSLPGTAKALSPEPNGFAFRQYKSLSKKEGNIFFSPYSVYTAFAMVYEGAAGATAQEMVAAFNFPKNSKTLRLQLSNSRRSLEIGKEKNKFSVSNSLWAQLNYKFKTSYINVLKEFYGAEAFNSDFTSNPERERASINAWVEKKTQGRIKDLFPANSINPLTRLVLANAVYFKGSWKTTFPKASTSEGDFFPAPEKLVKTLFMRSTKPFTLPYAKTKDAEVIELPYEGGTLAMIVILPAAGGMPALERTLTAKKLKEFDLALTEGKVEATLPKFSLGLDYDLKKSLRELGVKTAFTELANLSGMDGTSKLYIQKALHKSFIDVNEEGTEAAAATAVAVGLKSIRFEKTLRFTADRPFLFLIREKKSGIILFMGRFAKPQ